MGAVMVVEVQHGGSAIEDAHGQIHLSQAPPTVGSAPSPDFRLPHAAVSAIAPSPLRPFAQRSYTESAISSAYSQCTRARPTYEVAAMCIEPRLHRARQQLPARAPRNLLRERPRSGCEHLIGCPIGRCVEQSRHRRCARHEPRTVKLPRRRHPQLVQSIH